MYVCMYVCDQVEPLVTTIFQNIWLGLTRALGDNRFFRGIDNLVGII